MWPFPTHPPTPWTAKQIKQYAEQQRQQDAGVTVMSIEAMKLALEALNEWRVEWSPDFYEEKYDSDEPEENTRRTLVKCAITALCQAIEQAQKQERNFCPRCGKRLGKNDWDIHTCTPPAEQAQKQEPVAWIAHANVQLGTPDGKPAQKQEPVRLQCVVCETVYVDGVPPQTKETSPLQSTEQEPVGVVALIDGKKIGIIYDYSVNIDSDLYTSPPQRQPLTDEQLRVIENKINPQMRWRSSDEEGITLYPQEYFELVKAIEAAHGIGEKE